MRRPLVAGVLRNFVPKLGEQRGCFGDAAGGVGRDVPQAASERLDCLGAPVRLRHAVAQVRKFADIEAGLAKTLGAIGIDDFLTVAPGRQRYTHLRSGPAFEPGLPWPGPLSVIRYESGDFSADVTFDAEGVVVDYPGLGRMA